MFTVEVDRSLTFQNVYSVDLLLFSQCNQSLSLCDVPRLRLVGYCSTGVRGCSCLAQLSGGPTTHVLGRMHCSLLIALKSLVKRCSLVKSMDRNHALPFMSSQWSSAIGWTQGSPFVHDLQVFFVCKNCDQGTPG